MSSRFVFRGASLAMLVVLLTAASVSAVVTAPPSPPVRMSKISVPGNPLRAFDISWVDSASGHYYLADRSNGAIDVVDIETSALVSQIGGFVGNTGKNSTSGPDGVLTTFSNRELWAGDGDNRYYLAQTGAQNLGVIDAATLQVVGQVQSGVGAHSVAADLASNHIFVPLAGPDPACPNGCIAVYSSTNLDDKGLSRQH